MKFKIVMDPEHPRVKAIARDLATMPGGGDIGMYFEADSREDAERIVAELNENPEGGIPWLLAPDPRPE